MARDIRLLIAAQVDTAEQQIRQLTRTGSEAASILEKDFESLAVKSDLSYERQRAAAVASYDRIRNSGIASAEEITRAQLGMEARLQEIDRKIAGDISNTLEQGGVSWKEFVAARMGDYMRLEGGHAGAMKRISAEWAVYKESGANALSEVNARLEAMAASGRNVTDRLAKSFETLGIRSTAAIESERQAAVAAFDRIKVSGVASADEIGRAHQAMQAKLAGLDKEQRLQMLGTEAKEAAAGVNTLTNGFGSLQAIIATVGIGAFMKSLRDARIEMDAIDNSLAAAVQSEALAGQEMAFVAAWSDKMGLSLRQTAQDYAHMTASAKGTAIEGEGTRKVFQGVTTAATALHLSADRVHNIMVALNQMMSKGTVQTEELKGQLGESLPGAYNMAAKAMGLTTAELAKQLEKGEIMASDLLPRLAAEMEARFGNQIPKAIQSTQAEMNRLENATFRLKLALADSGMFASMARGTTWAVEGMQTLVMWMGQAKVFWGSLVDKGAAWVNAGGLIGMMKGGPAARAELKAEFDAIDKMAEASWIKWMERGGQKQPTLDPKALEAKRQQEVDAAEAKRREASQKAAKDTEKLQEKELAVFKATQEEKTAVVKAQKAAEMAVIKGQYEQGLVSTRDYYAAEKQLAVDAAVAKLEAAKEYLEKEEALLATIRNRSKKGDKDLDVQDELAKHEKAVKAVTVAEQELAKVVTEEGNKETKALRDRTDEYRKLSIAALEASGRYAEAESLRQEGDRKGVAFLRLKLEALSGAAGAAEALAAQESADAVKTAQARNKETEDLERYAKGIRDLQSELDKLSGKDQALLDKEKELNEGLLKQSSLRRDIAAAWAAGNAAAVSGISQQIQLQDQLNARLRQSLDLQQDLAVLSGKIVGFNNGKAIYADEGGAFVNGQAVNPYQTRGGAPSTFAPVTGASGSSPFVSLGSSVNGWSGPSFDVGTPYIERDMIAKVHKGERIVTAADNASGRFAGITVTGGISLSLVLPNVRSADEIDYPKVARRLKVELDNLDRRKRA